MTARCPDGHDSDWDDYCSVCGTAITSSPEAAATSESPAPPAEGGRCANCGAAYRVNDVFCESCGFDFASGTLPGAHSGAGGGASSEAGPGSPPSGEDSSPPAQVRIEVDSVWFEQAVGADELAFPEPVPQTATVALPGSKALVGRFSQSRGVFPEVDLAKLTGDPAVSTRHALIERDGQNGWTITDVGSTNGTKVGTELDTAEALKTGVAVPFGPGSSAWLGAWTRIDFGS